MLYANRKKTAPSVAEARRQLGQQTMEECAQAWLPRQRKKTEYSTAKTLASHFRAQINLVIGSRKLNSVTPTVVEDFLDHFDHALVAWGQRDDAGELGLAGQAGGEDGAGGQGRADRPAAWGG
ncbi:hypothetical protein AB0A91_18785 [Streptomyces sp. NPDC042207]|uniref:hypothetical protein n=1 Tax=Streptomyces sp. NPDC042207 TaxID=3154331 RepID=UPI0033DBF63C